MASLKQSLTAPVQEQVERAIEELMASLPDREQLSPAEQRGIIARYTAVLEGNFIYWMTAAHLAVASDEARAIIEDNLREEVRDNHPGMLRRFAIAADAVPSDTDFMAVYRHLEGVRRFVGEQDPVRIVVMMAFFEGWITRFMPYLADLATRRGSAEQEYTDVHGVVDIVHTEGLFRALEAEMLRAPAPVDPSRQLAGVELLRTLLETVLRPRVVSAAPVALGATAVEPLVVPEAA
jgi:hypothetical protein